MVRHHVDIVRRYDAARRRIQRKALSRIDTAQTRIWTVPSGRGRGRAQCITVFFLLAFILRSSVLKPHLNDAHIQAGLLS